MKKEYVRNRCALGRILILFVLILNGCGNPDKALVLTTEMAEQEPVVELPFDTENRVDTICVYVCGAVRDPGVVEIPRGSRVQDALEAAGGLTPDAGADAVNLARILQDEEMVRFPTAEEVLQQDNGGKVNINTADANELTTLTGIGLSRAEDIIRYREKHGRFQTIEDIMQVSGIKESVFEKIADQIAVE